MTVTLEDQVRKLHEDGLHDNVKALVALMLSLPEFSAPLNECQSIAKRYQLLVYYGHALYQDELYKQAELQFTEAIKVRKMLAKVKSKSTLVSKQSTLIPELEVQYSIYECYMKLKDYSSAMAVLESFAPKQRTSKINMKLGKLYEREGMERPAIMCYKEVLRSSPVAMEAAKCLLNLGVSLQEVNTLISFADSSASPTVPEWIAQYLKGYSFAVGNKHAKAVVIYRSLESQSLKNNVTLLCSLGESYYRLGNKRMAINCYEKVRLLDSLCLQGMDIYSQILAERNRKETLQKLTEELSEVNRSRPEPWVVLSYYCSSINENTRAEFFAQKAYMLDRTNVPAILAKANQLQILGKQEDAINHYREAIRLAPNQIESYKGIVDCFISCERYKEAMNIARNGHKTIGSNQATLTLCAKVCACELQTQPKAKAMLNKALAADPSYLPAACILSRILMKEDDYEAASELLKKQITMQNSDVSDYLSDDNVAEVHCLIGECLKELGDTQQSIVHYENALKYDPENKKAMQGIQSVERDVSDLDMSSIGVQETRDRSSIEELETPGPDLVGPLIF